jgi:hypothetical protein
MFYQILPHNSYRVTLFERMMLIKYHRPVITNRLHLLVHLCAVEQNFVGRTVIKHLFYGQQLVQNIKYGQAEDILRTSPRA